MARRLLRWVSSGCREDYAASDLNHQQAFIGAAHFAEMRDRAGRRFSIARRLTRVIFCPQSAIIAERASSGLPKVLAWEGAVSFFDTLSLSEQVRNFLLKEMTSGRLKPGGRINEAELARKLGISRNPIREAISGLAQRGYLVSLPRRGHRMRVLTVQDIDDVFSFRICVESFAIEQAVPRMTRRDLVGLRAIQDRMFEAAADNNVTGMREADVALHREICELSGNRKTLLAHEAIDTEVQILIACVDLELESLAFTAAAHLPIVEALEARDASRAVASMQHHLRATWAGVHAMHRRAGLLEASAYEDEERYRPALSGSFQVGGDR
jgi:DNA-binding GntR family transcriptional regulator